jgi:hypothetical protein
MLTSGKQLVQSWFDMWYWRVNERLPHGNLVQTPPLPFGSCVTSQYRIVFKNLSQIDSSTPCWNPTNSITGPSFPKVWVLLTSRLSSWSFEESLRRHLLSMPGPFYHVTLGCVSRLNHTRRFGLWASTLSMTTNSYVPELRIDELK